MRRNFTPHIDPRTYVPVAQRLYTELGRTPTKLELRRHGLPSAVRVSAVVEAAGLPLRPRGGQTKAERAQRKRKPTAMQLDREGLTRNLMTLRGYRYRRPTDDLPLEGWMR